MNLTVSDSLLSNLFIVLGALFIWSAVIARAADMDTWFGKVVWLTGVLVIGFGGILTLLIWAEGQGFSLLQ